MKKQTIKPYKPLFAAVKQDGSMFPCPKTLWLLWRPVNTLWKMSVQDCLVWPQLDGTLQLSVIVPQMGTLVLASPMTLTMTLTGLDYQGGLLIRPTQHLFLCTSILMSSEALSLPEYQLRSAVFDNDDLSETLGFVAK